MIRSSLLGSFVLAASVGGLMANSPASAGDEIYGGVTQIGSVTQIADHCARYGDGFVDVGNGVCGRIGGHIRVGGTRNAAMGGWPSDGTSNAAMRTTSPSMVPGGEITRLRVRGNLDSASPFR